MTATSVDIEVLSKDVTEIQRLLMKASTTIPKGAMVILDANGLAINATPTASTQFAGIALSGETSAASGNYYIHVARNGRHLLTTSGMAQSNVGDMMYAADNQTVGATASNAHKIGPITEFVSATQVWVDIAEGTKNPSLGT